MAAVFMLSFRACRKGGGGCSGDNLAKTESTIDIMADGPNKITAQKEGRWRRTPCSAADGACGMHLSKAMPPKWASKQDLSQQGLCRKT